jgi:hypothetical protein
MQQPNEHKHKLMLPPNRFYSYCRLEQCKLLQLQLVCKTVTNAIQIHHTIALTNKSFYSKHD